MKPIAALLLSILLCGCVVTGSKTATSTSVSASGLSVAEAVSQLPGTVMATAITLKQLLDENPIAPDTLTNVSNWTTWAKIAATVAGIPTPAVVTDAEKVISAVTAVQGK